MAFKGLVGGASGDMGNANDFFGYYDDTVYVVYEVTAHNYNIFSYRGNDLIDLRDANASNIHFVYSGIGDDTILGGAGLEVFRDQSGNDLVYGGDGVDTFVAGRGNDTFYGGAGADIITFASYVEDNGTPISSFNPVRFDMAISGVQDLGFWGRDRISGFEQVSGSGGNDTLLGRNANDTIFGGGGSDLLFGRAGADSLWGSTGADTLVGGAGADQLLGDLSDGARNIFRYLGIKDSGIGTDFARVDRIFDFGPGATATSDRIDLRAIDANSSTARNDAFIFRASGDFTARGGEVRLQVIGSDTLVHVDIDGDAASEMNFWVMDVITLTAGDFLL